MLHFCFCIDCSQYSFGITLLNDGKKVDVCLSLFHIWHIGAAILCSFIVSSFHATTMDNVEFRHSLMPLTMMVNYSLAYRAPNRYILFH